MKKLFILGVIGTVFIAPLMHSLPPEQPAEEYEEEAAPDATTPVPAPAAATPQPQTEAAPVKKAEILPWPLATPVSESDKPLLQAHSKEIVQLFTEAQALCKNMDETLQGVNEQRDAAQRQYRALVNQLDPLFQNIGAAQADNKNRKEN